jgi:hypothetical protein
MGTVNQEIILVTNHWTHFHLTNEVLHPVTGKEMEYMTLMKDPVLQLLWKRGFGNEMDRLLQGIHDIQRTTTFF